MRFYRALLRLYPDRFRDEYADELCRAFSERARGRSRIVQWILAINDVVPNAIGAHWDIARHGAAAGTAVPAFSGDIRFALRQIRRTPVFSGIIISVIALGIGLSAALLTTLDTYAWRPAPGIGTNELVRLLPRATRDNRSRDIALTESELRELRAQTNAFAELAAWDRRTYLVDFGAGPSLIKTTYTTDNFFRTLHVSLAAGSGFPAGADSDAAPIAVISNDLWMREFNGSSDAVGRTIRIDNHAFTIVGVAPPLFTGVDVESMDQPVVWIPLGAHSLLEPRTNVFQLESAARLANGVSASHLPRLLSPLAARLEQQNAKHRTGFVLKAERLRGMRSARSSTHELLAAFFVVIVLVVIITCTNVSALLLGRAVSRRREVGVRLAMGATRRRIIRQMLTESLVYAASGAALGLALYAASITVARVFMPDLMFGLTPRAITFFYASIFALLTTMVFGIAPAIHATSADIAEVMKNSGTHAIKRSRIQMIFVIAQLACSQPVLVVTSLVLADMSRWLNSGAERASASVVSMSVELTRTTSGLETIHRRLNQFPGVESASLAFRVDGESIETEDHGSTPNFRQFQITTEHFSTLGIPIIRGRPLSADDSRVAVISVHAVRKLWPGEDPLGKRLVRRSPIDGVPPTTLEVVGVAGNPAYDSYDDTDAVYVPLSTIPPINDHSDEQRVYYSPILTVRAESEGRAIVPAVRSLVREIDPTIGIGGVQTLAERYASRTKDAVQSNMAAFGIGIVALLLASLGLYAIVAYSVAQRTREIGIRLAMGSTPTGIVAHFLRYGLRVSLIALTIGIPATVAGIQIVQANAIGFTLRDAATVLIVVPVLVAVTLIACWLPARRAGRVDPLVALRTE